MRSDTDPAGAKKADEKRKLNSRNDRGRQSDEETNSAPAHYLPVKSDCPERAQQQRGQADPVPDCIRKYDAKRFQTTNEGEAIQGCADIDQYKSVEQSSEANAEKGHGQDQTESKSRSAKQRSKHSIPDQFHEQECEACNASGDEYKYGGRPGFGLYRINFL